MTQSSTVLSVGHLPFGLIAPGMLKMTQYPFATVVGSIPTVFPWSQAAMNNETKPHALM